MNAIDIILLALVAAAVFFAGRHVWRRRGKGCCGECGSCAGCAACGACPHKGKG